MRDTWFQLVDVVLRPSRPHLERCARGREDHLAVRRGLAEERARAIASCVHAIEGARTLVFEANDGVISSRMTELEREWRMLSRPDPDGGMMDLWARIAPPSWIDRKRWRDGEPATRVDMATALAADPDGVEAAESAIGSLRRALAPWGTVVGSRIRWRPFERDSANTVALLAEALRVARETVARGDSAAVVIDRAEQLERELREAMDVRFPERPQLSRDVAHAAFVDHLWKAAALVDVPNPVAPLHALWTTGYGLESVDAAGVSLELPSL